MDILTGENFSSIYLIWTSFIGQLIHPVGGAGWVKGVYERYRFLASCVHHFIKVHENISNKKLHLLFLIDLTSFNAILQMA